MSSEAFAPPGPSSNTPDARRPALFPRRGRALNFGATWPALRRLLRVLLLTATALSSAACGKRRPPLPPFESVPQRTELLSGAQRGNQVLLSWPAPRRNAPEGSVQSIRRIDVYRLAEEVDDPLPLTEEEFSSRATLIGSVALDQTGEEPGTMSYVDELRLAEPVRLRYALRYVNASGQRAPFSNFLLIEPASAVSRPPTLDDAVEVSQNSIVIKWQPPATNIDDSAPPNLSGYNVYRTSPAQNEAAQKPLNAEPLKSNRFADRSFQFGREYNYVVRALSLGTEGKLVESLNSNAVTVNPVDTFSPSAPTGLTAAASPAPPRISLFFAANPEGDVAGYMIYRSTDPSLPKESWTRLNDRPSEKTTYQDESVGPNTRYYYYVKAQDRAGNISEPSEVVSDQLP